MWRHAILHILRLRDELLLHHGAPVHGAILTIIWRRLVEAGLLAWVVADSPHLRLRPSVGCPWRGRGPAGLMKSGGRRWKTEPVLCVLLSFHHHALRRREKNVLHGMLSIVTRGAARGTSGTWVCQGGGCVDIFLRLPLALALGCRRCAATSRFGSRGTSFVIIPIILILLRFDRLDDDAVVSVNITSLRQKNSRMTRGLTSIFGAFVGHQSE